jgi:hypothetical protein
MPPTISNPSSIMIIYVEIRKCMYGLPQAGCLSQLRLISTSSDLYQNTSCLIQHETLDVTFSLVVDHFGIRYGSQSDANHLSSSLLSVLTNDYEPTIKSTGNTYLCMNISLDLTSFSLYIPGYITKTLQRFRPQYRCY